MPAVSKELESSQWRQTGLRMHPEVQKALRIRSAKSGESMEDILHRTLVRELRQNGDLPATFSEGR